LNPRPSDYKSDALPTELRRQLKQNGQLNDSKHFGNLPFVETKLAADKRFLKQLVKAGNRHHRIIIPQN
jgi:hypothetical protein